MKKVLFSSEFSLNSTGYSAMTFEICSRLHATGKYELLELATYCSEEDWRINKLPWKVIPVVPRAGSSEFQMYSQMVQAQPLNQFGMWKFEQVLLDFQPDVVCDFRDIFMMDWEAYSPLRPFYRLLWMPTVDSTPQMDEWISHFTLADALLTYTNFGYRTLKEHAGKNINLVGVASPGVNFNDMMPLDKNAVRTKYGIDKDSLIMTMVARNQIRKLYPDLFAMFREFLDTAPKELTDKTFLHIHTSYPDMGWDIPRILKQHGIGHKALFTYLCRHCGEVKVNRWNDTKLVCPRCLTPSMFFTGPGAGIKRKTLCEIYNLSNLYIQYAALEGFGIPIVEAAACGIPVCNVDFSAMEDFSETLGAVPIEVQRLTSESPTHRQFAFPHNSNFVNRLIELLSSPSSLKEMGKRTYELCKKNYDWDNIAKIWEKTIDGLPEPELKWNHPRRTFQPVQIPDNLNNDQFLTYCMLYIAANPDLLKSPHYNRMLTGLYTNQLMNGNTPQKFDRNNVIEICQNMRSNLQNWENIRCEKLGIK